MITAEDIMFWLPGLVDKAWTFKAVAKDVADGINWRAPEERRRQARVYVREARAVRDFDPGGADGFLFFARLLIASLRPS